jgi:uncharacterized membrane protein YcaP (DUF421 family)
MAGAYTSLPDGLLLVGTLVFWNYLLDWLSYRSEVIRRLIEPPPLLLVRNGEMLRRNMRKESISEDELRAQLREKGVDDMSSVRKAFLESDGRVSVIEGKGGRRKERGKSSR